MRGDRECGRNAGFSLVEILVVLAILALATGIGVASVRGVVPSQRLNAAAEAVVAEIALLRTEAHRTGRATSLVFDGEAYRFVSSRPGAPALAMAGWRVHVETGAASRLQPGELRFLPDGGSTGARITLSGLMAARVLSVSRATAFVRQTEVGP